MNEAGDAQATGTVDDAAAQIEALMEPKGDPEGVETQEPEASQEETEEVEDSEDQAQEEPEQPEEQPTYRVKVAGEEVEVSLDELVKGYSREADYSRKTMALGEEAKAFKAEADAVRAERAQYATLLGQLEAQLVPEISEQDLEWLRVNNRAEYAIQLHERQAAREQRANLQAERNRVLGLNDADEGKAHQEHIKSVLTELPKLVPEFADPAKQQAAAQELQTFLSREGYTPDEIKWASARDLSVVWKASKYDQLMAKKPAAVERVQAVRTSRPGAGTSQPSKVTELTRSKQRLAKTGRVEDAAAAIERMLG